MGSGRYLIIEDDDVVAEIEEGDVIQAKKAWGDEPNIVIARIIWENGSKATPVSYPKPEGECLDNYL